jgi:opacity protein-like surface antigen
LSTIIALLVGRAHPPARADSPTEGAAATATAAVAPAAPVVASVWRDGVGSGFRKGVVNTGLVLGLGIGTHSLGSKERHDLALAVVRCGRTLGRNWEFVGELFGGEQLRPRDRSVFGLTAIMRYNFATRSAWEPFLDGGVGVALTNIRDGDLSTAFEFNDQLGAGMHYFLRDGTALTFQYRWLHLSNAGIQHPNNGTNTQMFYLGMSWFYR